MIRAARCIGPVIAIATLAISGSSCEFMPDPEFEALKSTLELRVVDVHRKDDAGSLEFLFQLNNRGNASATACLGPDRSVSYDVGSGGGTSSTFVDHPGCIREFEIAAGATMSWRESLEVQRLAENSGTLSVEVQIVNPARCGNWGNCASFELKSNEVTLQ